MQQYVLYSRVSDHETILELWGASTKHPDSIFKLSNFTLAEYIPVYRQLFQWILFCASALTFPVHARELTDFALDVYEASRKVPLD